MPQPLSRAPLCHPPLTAKVSGSARDEAIAPPLRNTTHLSPPSPMLYLCHSTKSLSEPHELCCPESMCGGINNPNSFVFVSRGREGSARYGSMTLSCYSRGRLTGFPRCATADRSTPSSLLLNRRGWTTLSGAAAPAGWCSTEPSPWASEHWAMRSCRAWLRWLCQLGTTTRLAASPLASPEHLGSLVPAKLCLPGPPLAASCTLIIGDWAIRSNVSYVDVMKRLSVTRVAQRSRTGCLP